MISALLSNTPVSGLRGSGLAGDTRTVADEQLLARGGTTVREALAAPSVVARSTGSVPALDPGAIVALQEGDESQGTSTRRSGSGQANGEAEQQQSTVRRQAEAEQAQRQAQEEAERREDPDGDGLNDAQEKQVQDLKQRDREVRAHEQAHARVGGQYASAPTYTFQQGPDGKRYAIGGEVQIDTSTERTPEATIRKMQVVIRAALAPAEPSSQDLRVAQQARASLSEAQSELRQQQAEELRGGGDDDARSASSGEPASGSQSAGSQSQDSSSGRNGGEAGSADVAQQEAVAAYARAVDQARQLVAAGNQANQLF